MSGQRRTASGLPVGPCNVAWDCQPNYGKSSLITGWAIMAKMYNSLARWFAFSLLTSLAPRLRRVPNERVAKAEGYTLSPLHIQP